MMLPNEVYVGGRGGRDAYKEVEGLCQARGRCGDGAAGLRNVCPALRSLPGMLSPSGLTMCSCVGL